MLSIRKVHCSTDCLFALLLIYSFLDFLLATSQEVEGQATQNTDASKDSGNISGTSVDKCGWCNWSNRLFAVRRVSWQCRVVRARSNTLRRVSGQLRVVLTDFAVR